MGKTVKGSVVLRNFNTQGEVRYLNVRAGYLVPISEAQKFRSPLAAERFLKQNPEFTGYRVERVS